MESWPAPVLPRLPGRGLPPRIYDSATREVRPIAAGQVATMYVCGITPYDATHLGHAFTYLTFDLLYRTLGDAGHDVAYAQNVTDVDDPLLERAARDGEDWRDLAAREIQLFRDDMAALRIRPPRAYVGAVEAIPLITEAIEVLRERGTVYELERDLYFSVAAAPRIGEVAHLPHAEMVRRSAENGGDPDRPGKKDPIDPLLWLAARPGEPRWDSPFGPGRPGWHVECSAIAQHHLGPTIDIQGGGDDLIYPHHEFSAAHAEAVSGKAPFARLYVHTGMVGFDGHKMSKSRGNLVLVSALRADGVDPMAVRLALLTRPRREAWEWTADLLSDAEARLARWRAAVTRPTGPIAGPLLDTVRERLADDLDAPGAVAAVDRWVDAALTGGGADPDAPTLTRDLVDALLGVAL